jgi:hypothetical protein
MKGIHEYLLKCVHRFDMTDSLSADMLMICARLSTVMTELN